MIDNLGVLHRHVLMLCSAESLFSFSIQSTDCSSQFIPSTKLKKENLADARPARSWKKLSHTTDFDLKFKKLHSQHAQQ
jgi:hypothetical protein